MKTEPDTFSFDDLMNAPQHITSWEGVRNYQARNMMRDAMKIGDQVLIYHSRIPDPAIVGTAEVVHEAHPDPTALDPKSPYFDEKSKKAGASRWCMVDIQGQKALPHPVTRTIMKDHPILSRMKVMQKGMRLSIMPVSQNEWEAVLKAGK